MTAKIGNHGAVQVGLKIEILHTDALLINPPVYHLNKGFILVFIRIGFTFSFFEVKG